MAYVNLPGACCESTTTSAAAPTMRASMKERIRAQHMRRAQNPGRIGLKVNLYRDYELHAVAAADEATELKPNPIECFMVGDSYFMTHLGRASTRLREDEYDWALALIADLMEECRVALERCYAGGSRPYLLGDFPDGAAATPGRALASARRLIDAGAEAVKIEIVGEESFAILQELAATGYPVVAHLGYTPQNGAVRRHGATAESLHQICQAARRARDCGAIALVLEMVTESANRLLSRPHPAGLCVHSIFSGRAEFGGQCLNVWDAVFRPNRPTKYFPPTATLNPEADRGRYGPAIITSAMAELLRMTVDGAFPLSPPEQSPCAESFDPWSDSERSPNSTAAVG